MSRIFNLNNDNFDKAINKTNNLIVIFFWAAWCGHCGGLIPILEELSEEMPNVSFVSIDKDEGLSIAERFQIGSVPTFLFFKKGEVIDNILGRMTKEQLIDKINKFIL
ncbi:thioredoxin [Clostridium cavendishii DSM 21758]|uniref:Thioredoxin n=1 Tax=Clostridium cavendishii DSM 21758 TaxID=1121302 RepID=A0A1M6JIR7_9CLOT|nr:thioredoxin family protein [Clostridium cavendishii]SHJ46515.1 thioredoxin [Clostridium cavendishii DSM 21758]